MPMETTNKKIIGNLDSIQSTTPNNKCVVRIRGGLGNQLFQYSYAYLLCKNAGIKEIVMDIREYNHYYWPFELSKFKLPLINFYTDCSQKYDRAIRRYHFKVFLHRWFHKKQSQDFYDKKLLKKDFIFCGRECNLPDLKHGVDYYLYGYFQNSLLLENIRNDIVDFFSLKEATEKTKRYIKRIKRNSISVSVRFPNKNEIKRNVNYKYYGKDKYLELINKVHKKRGENLQVVVSSNDVNRIMKEKWFDGYDTLFIDGCSASEQIEILKNCRDFILSNSTFSWWIAYLGSYNKSSIVLAPRFWFTGIDIFETNLIFNEIEVFN